MRAEHVPDCLRPGFIYQRRVIDIPNGVLDTHNTNTSLKPFLLQLYNVRGTVSGKLFSVIPRFGTEIFVWIVHNYPSERWSIPSSIESCSANPRYVQLSTTSWIFELIPLQVANMLRMAGLRLAMVTILLLSIGNLGKARNVQFMVTLICFLHLSSFPLLYTHQGRLHGLAVACWTTDQYHSCSNLGVGISKGCFIFDFASLPLEVALPI